MKKLSHFASVLAAGLSTSACQSWNTLESQARVDPVSAATYKSAGNVVLKPNSAEETCGRRQLRGDSYAVPINLDCFEFPGGANAYAAATESSTDRNRLASVLMKHSDDVCTKELGDMSAREAISNVVLGTITSGLSTVSSIVTGEKLKSWLAGGASFSNATRDHINSEVFRNVLASAMAKAIENDRVKRRAAIRTHNGDTIGNYTVDEMIADVNRYHQSCSFYNGLVLVVDAVNRASPSIAVDYRNKTAAISDLSMRIAELDRRVAEAGLANEERETYRKQLADLVAQRTKIEIERSNLGAEDEKPE